jgi:hypothetical protein
LNSSAHCFEYGDELNDYRVIIGLHTVTQPLEEQFFIPTEIVIHPKFIYRKDYDIFDMAIVIVDRVIQFTHIVKPICLPHENDDELFWNHNAIVSGEFYEF